MADPKVFDAEKVADLAKQLKAAQAEVLDLRIAARDASHRATSAECRLRNLQAQFTRAADAHVDPDALTPRTKCVAVEA